MVRISLEKNNDAKPKSKTSKTRLTTKENLLNKTSVIEKQGPTDFSTRALKSKYRGEHEREEAWREWLRSVSLSNDAVGLNMIIPVTKVERHPFYTFYYKRLYDENLLSANRTRARLLMKRFVYDVQEVWLTNLQHLREYQPNHMFSGSEGDRTSDVNFSRGTGIKNRRDVKGIENMDCQIPSVSQRRVFDKAYHTARMPPLSVALDYQPAPTPSLSFLKLIPPVIESLIECFPLQWLGSNSIENVSTAAEPPSVFTERDFLLHIDRLIPSSDYQVSLQRDVLWRLTLFRCSDLHSQAFVTTEDNIASYVTGIIQKRLSNELDRFSASNLTYSAAWCASAAQKRLIYTKCVFELREVNIGWRLSSSLMSTCQIVINVLGYSDEIIINNEPLSEDDIASIKSIRIEVCATPEMSNNSRNFHNLYLECFPAELKYLLQMPTAPLWSVPWWSDVARCNDLWPFLMSHLSIESENSTADSPTGLCFGRYPRTAADRVEGALSTLVALSCANELLELLSLQVLDEPSVSKTFPVGIALHTLRDSFLKPCQDSVCNIGSLEFNTDTADVPLLVHDEPSESEIDRDSSIRSELFSGRWEPIVNFSGYNLSLQASGAVDTVTQVPGACEHGRRGLWFPDMNNDCQIEMTQAAARLFRDAHLSTTDSVLVNMTLALDTALLFPTLLAWEDYSTFPQPAPFEEVQCSIPGLSVSPISLLINRLHSPIQDRMSHTVTIFTTLPVEGVDYLPLDAPRKPSGYCRHFPFKNQYGFRQQLTTTLLGVDPVLATMVFGVTRLGAVANSPGVNSRNLWHFTVPITEHINRPRAPSDYHYILSNLTNCGCNDPTSYTTRMRATEMVGLRSSAFSNYEDQYGSIQELRKVFHKQLALDSRIEKVQSDLKLKERMQVGLIRDELQRAYEKKLRKATKSETGWKSRFKVSSLVELQGNWERRRDDRTGLYFFRKLVPHSITNSETQTRQEERFSDTCQWEVPAQWDGDPLSAASAVDTVVGGSVVLNPTMRDQPGVSSHKNVLPYNSTASMYSELDDEELDHFDTHQTTAQHRTMAGVPFHTHSVGRKGAFDQPPDSWFPAGNNAQLTLDSNTRAERKALKVFDPVKKLGNGRSQDSMVSTAGADKSHTESVAATIDTVNLEHIAEQLVSSDELMRVIAKRLGLPESQIVPADDLSSVFSITSGQIRADKKAPYNALNAPRDEWVDDANMPEFDSDDDLWSDDDHAAGDFDEELELGQREDMPGTQLEAAQFKRKQWRLLHQKDDFSAPVSVPYLHLPKANTGTTDQENADTREEVFGWRRLPRPMINPGFLSNSLLTHTRGPDKNSSNTLNAPVFLMPISPIDACKYIPQEFDAHMESIFVPDAKKDMERSIATVERNVRREEELSRNLPTDDLLLFGEAKEFTSVDAYLARQQREDQAAVADPKEEAREKAILAAKSTNIAQMEDALAEDIPINTADEFGNTLLILASQQGSRRMCKFLLRRGANINLQSLAGNTPLHYCYAYSQISLGEYLKSKGADDSIINVDGLTCYEGLSRESMNEEYGDQEEEEEDEGDYAEDDHSNGN